MGLEILQAFILIFLAEMGDKTQILAMAFATRYPVRKVLLGIAIGSFLNHGLAVILGTYISTLIPIESIQLVSGFAFIGFAFWTLKTEDDEDEEEGKMKYGPVLTVALAFFIGELGDKTQLTAITLATEAVYPYLILLGTVAGMVVTGGLGIIVGKKMGDKIPEVGIKLISGCVFMLFGVQKVYANAPGQYLNTQSIILFLSIILLITTYLVYKLYNQSNSLYKAKAKLLQEHFKSMEARLDKLCLGEEFCKNCNGASCEIGFAKKLVKHALDNATDISTEQFIKSNLEKKPFDKKALSVCLSETIQIIEEVKNGRQNKPAHYLRMHLEDILIDKKITEYINLESYLAKISEIDTELYNHLKETV